LAAAAMVLSLVEVVVRLFVRLVLGSSFIFSRSYQLSVRVLCVLASLAALAVGAMCFPAKISFCKTSESRFAKRGTLLREKTQIWVIFDFS
jgi:hypothetical protein